MSLFDLLAVSVNACDNEERVDDLMSFEETAGDISVDHACDVINEDVEAVFEDLGLRALLNGCIEETLDIGQRVLVHGVDSCQVGDHEVQDRATDGHCTVLVTRVVDFFFDNQGLGYTLVDLLRCLL